MTIDVNCWIKRESRVPEDNTVKIQWGLRIDCIIDGVGYPRENSGTHDKVYVWGTKKKKLTDDSEKELSG